MSENRKCVTIIWKIKNFSFNYIEILDSPSFFVQEIGETKWKLELYSNSKLFKDCIACYINKEDCDRGPAQYELDYELSFLASDGSVLHSEKYFRKFYAKGGVGSSALYMKRDEVFLLKKDLFIPDDTLTIRCRMWDRLKQISQPERCFAETRMGTECRTFIGIIKKFSNREANCKNLVSIKSSSTETFLSSMNLCVATDGKLVIEMKPVDNKSIKMYRCKIFIRDVFGNTWKSGQGEFYNTEPQCISLAISKEYLMENKGYCLQGDLLTIECEIILPTGKTTQKIHEPEYGFDTQDTQELISNDPKTYLCSEEQHIENLTTLKDDWISVLREGILCDTKLKTTTETFPAHKIVLSARSPVFKSMFTTDMKEKTNNCVDIDDLDADTVRRMLSFMYSDTLDDLQFESAKSLFFVADKYNISSLRYRCSNFLKQNLLVSNCCEVLLLADRHQDKVLKNAVQDYIAENDEVVLFSDEWKNLEKNHPQLSIEILRTVYVRNRKS